MADDQAGQGPPIGFVIDRRGVPTSHAAYDLIEWLFNHRGRCAHLSEIAKDLKLPQSLIQSMCRQLKLLDMVLEEPALSRRFRYHLDCWDFELQAAVETALLDYQMRGHPGLPDRPAA